MNKLLTGTCAVAAMLMVSACSDTWNPSSDREGRILPGISLNKEVAAPKVKARAAEEAPDAVGVDQLQLRLTPEGSDASQTWPSVADFPTGTDFAVGTYLMEAFYGDAEQEGFEKPYYYGSQTLTVLENKATPVNITASLANAMVTVTVSEAVKQYFASYATEIASSTGATIAYGNTETRPAYVKAGTVNVNVNVTKQTGVSAKLTPVTFQAEPRHHYHIAFDVNGGNTGAGQLTVTFSSAMVDEEVELDLSDQILTAPAPTLAATGFTSGVNNAFAEGTPFEDGLKVTASAQAGLRTVVMTTASPYLIRKGWPAEVDFATADAATLANLRVLGLNFRGLEGTKSRMAFLDFTAVAASLKYVEGADNSTLITLIAKDAATKASQPVELKLNVQQLIFEIADVDALAQDDTQLLFTLRYNGAPACKDVTFELQNDRGTFNAVAPASITPVAGAESTYRVALPVKPDGDVTFRLNRGTSVLPPVKVPRRTVAATVDDNRTWTTTSVITLTDASQIAQSASAKVMLSTDGVNYTAHPATASGAELHLANLTPGTAYKARVLLDGGYRSKVLAINTEAELQIPNGNLDAPTSISDSQSNWERVEFPGWGTNNTMTTSQGANYGYCRISGTIADPGRNGNCALIRTVGWGSNNSALWSVAAGAMKYSDAGLLHLGSTRAERPSGYTDREGALTTDDLECGIPFASRPKAISFWYKYSAKNGSDRGFMEVWLKDGLGNMLVHETRDLVPASAYTNVTIPLTYADNAPKGAKLYVKFLSTNNRTFLQKNDSNFSGPGFGNLNRGTYMGSQLSVDDITLSY